MRGTCASRNAGGILRGRHHHGPDRSGAQRKRPRLLGAVNLKLAPVERRWLLLLFLRGSLLLSRRLFLGCVLHRVILPLHQITRHSLRERGCVFFIRFFALKVKKKMNERVSMSDACARATQIAKREKNISCRIVLVSGRPFYAGCGAHRRICSPPRQDADAASLLAFRSLRLPRRWDGPKPAWPAGMAFLTTDGAHPPARSSTCTPSPRRIAPCRSTPGSR